jgi:NADH dehydrogenase
VATAAAPTYRIPLDDAEVRMPDGHVVVIGGGFGGLTAVKALARAPVRVTLIDKRNHHLFQPLLYQVATAALAPSDIAEPLRAILGRQGNAEVLLAEVLDVDVARKVVITEAREVRYDYLVLAAGAESNWFGHGEWVPNAPGLKTISDALEIRQRVLEAFEEVEWSTDPERVRQLLTFAVIGGGPTGVEMAGAIQEIACYTLVEDFKHVDPKLLRVVLIEAVPKILTAMPDPLQEAAKKHLTDLGVELWLGRPVERIEDGLVVAGGEELRARTIVWAAGVRASPLAKALGAPLDRAGRVVVRPDLSIPDHPEVFAIGDLAHVDQEGGTIVPGVAPAAMQMGKFVARAIVADHRGKPRGTFVYKDKGSLATIGRSRAVADLPFGRFRGFVAWMIWAVVHLMSIVSYRNRAVVAVKWLWSWFTFDRSSRVMWRDEQERDARYDLTRSAGQALQHAQPPQATPDDGQRPTPV